MIEKIKSYSGTITAVFSALVVLYGVFKFVNNGVDNTETTKAILNQYKATHTTDSVINLRLDSLSEIALRTYQKATSTDNKVENIKNQFARHLSKDKSVTKEELLQIINDMDQKKNGTDLYWTPYSPNE